MRRNCGFTALDLLVVVGTILLFVGFALPHFSSTGCKGRSSRINCLSNLKQIGVAFRMWGNDNGEAFPMAVPFDKGGGREFALAGEPAPVFRVMAKELNTPKVLVCREDKKRFRTNDFSGMTERNLSYFIGIDANESNPQTILTGDRNLTLSNAPVSRGLVLITNPKAASWSRALHNQQGNLGLADGSAMQLNGAGLQRSLQANNRFAVP